MFLASMGITPSRPEMIRFMALVTPDCRSSSSIVRIAVQEKEKILNELDKLNINERTIFPFIENTAKYVAGK